ncbi:MAG: PucR family transcriptional regulator ligand-binding domain-containing protein [Nitriliruptor sp.]|uniref:PucR family transcriptional regulator n=1 Tax=Nitriliruptor sp. TaxID=2448056 RepID=UPI0034A080B0
MPSATGPTAGLPDAQALREVLETPSLSGSQVLAGATGLDRAVTRLNVMEVPDIGPWVKPDEFLLTTAYPLRGRPGSLPQLVEDLDDAGLAGLGIKLGRYLDEVPADMLAVADARGFPIVQLPEHVCFDDILNEVLTTLLNRQARQLARSERIHRAFLGLVLGGLGLPEIARDLAELLDGPAAIIDLDGAVLASARLDELDAADGPPPGRFVVDLPARRAWVEDEDGRQLGCSGVVISAGAREHGYVIGLRDGDPPPLDLVALENAATVAALELTKKLEVQAVEDKYRSDLMHDLLRQVEDRDDVLHRAAGFGWDLDRRVVVLVVRLDQPGDPVVPDEVTRRAPLLSVIRPAIVERDPGAAVARFSHEVVIVTAAFEGSDGRGDARRFAGRLLDQASRSVGVTLSAGLSRPVHDVRDIAGAYDQASRALVIGRRIHGPGALAHFDELGAYRVLSLVEDQAELRSFADEVLGELAADTAAAADLRATLQALLDAGGNVAQAARQLHFHYNTLRYRIEKLESMLGPFTTDARVRLDVQLALLVLAMHGGSSSV